MATVTKPMALDETFNTTETTPRNQADVLAAIEEAIRQSLGRTAADVSYDNTTSGLAADDVQEAVDELAAEKVDKVDGKGLSTNDYTTAEKEKLAGIEAGAEVNTVVPEDIESTQTATGNPLTLTDCAPINAESLVVEFSPKQEGSGDPSPTNIRPITGYTECEVGSVGKNLFDPSTVGTGYINDVDGAAYTTVPSNHSDYIEVKPNTYYCMTTSQTSGLWGAWYDANKDYISGITLYNQGKKQSPNNAKYLRITVNYNNNNTDYANNVMVEEGESHTTFVPYQSTSATIQFGQTVYGGSVDFSGGTKNNRYSYVLTGAETNIYKHSDATDVFGIYMQDIVTSLGDIVGDSQTLVYRGHCSAFIPSIYAPTTQILDHHTDSYAGVFGNVSLQGIWFKFRESTFADLTVEQLKTKLAEWYAAGTPLQYVFDIVDTDISTPPTPLPMLKGTNNLTTNGTTISLGYQPDNVIGELKGEIEALWDYILSQE